MKEIVRFKDKEIESICDFEEKLQKTFAVHQLAQKKSIESTVVSPMAVHNLCEQFGINIQEFVNFLDFLENTGSKQDYQFFIDKIILFSRPINNEDSKFATQRFQNLILFDYFQKICNEGELDLFKYGYSFEELEKANITIHYFLLEIILMVVDQYLYKYCDSYFQSFFELGNLTIPNFLSVTKLSELPKLRSILEEYVI